MKYGIYEVSLFNRLGLSTQLLCCLYAHHLYLFICKYLYNAHFMDAGEIMGKKSNYTHTWSREYLKCSESKGIIGMSNKYFLEESGFFFISEKEVNL